jgi:hypothetical protein
MKAQINHQTADRAQTSKTDHLESHAHGLPGTQVLSPLRQLAAASETVQRMRDLQKIADQSGSVQRLEAYRQLQHGGTERGQAPVQRLVNFKQMTGEVTTPSLSQILVWLDRSMMAPKAGSRAYAAIERMIASGAVHQFEWAYGQVAFMQSLQDYMYTTCRGPFGYAWAAMDPNGLCRLEVRADGEADIVGYAEFRIHTMDAQPSPTVGTVYGKGDVLARAGKVAHLTHLYNTTLLRSGPNDIHAGFGAVMLQRCEQMAKEICGARLMYLEAAGAAVRTDPNSDARVMQNSTSFYAKYGYGTDGIAAAHNWAIARAEAEGFGLGGADSIAYIQKTLKNYLEGMLSKTL